LASTLVLQRPWAAWATQLSAQSVGRRRVAWLQSTLSERALWFATALLTASCLAVLILLVVHFLEADVQYVRAQTPAELEAGRRAWSRCIAFIATALFTAIWSWPRVASALPRLEMSRSGLAVAGASAGLVFWPVAAFAISGLHLASSPWLLLSPSTFLLSVILALSFSLPRLVLTRLSPGTFSARNALQAAAQQAVEPDVE
jgi:hypothetical protein